jgi:hypothetical protein
MEEVEEPQERASRAGGLPSLNYIIVSILVSQSLKLNYK